MDETFLIMRKLKTINPYGRQLFFNVPLNPNFHLIKVGAHVIMEAEIDGEITFVGYGDISSIEPNRYAMKYRIGETVATIREFKKFFPPRRKNAEIRNMLNTVPRYYWFDTIRPITKEVYDKILDFCGRKLSDLPPNRQILSGEVDPLLSLFNKEESREIEFKSTLRTPLERNKAVLTLESKVANSKNSLDRKEAEEELKNYLDSLPRNLEYEVLKTISAFSNSPEGGVLIIGIDDWGHIVGIEPDYSSLSVKRDWDGWLLTLKDVVKQNLGVIVAAAQNISPYTYNDKTLALIEVPFSSEPVFFKWKNNRGIELDEFFVRVQNSTQSLSRSEQHKYISTTWK